ncbi:UNC119 [Trypanosoma equiperdum]|uniref:GMP phosphodiesterase delta subunit domain-containing protein n=4 Tax=Trypanozoon TaxID=39700 RepID=Q586Q9_TRYB2|nr:hypothetical protein, conserved [Trypanosoma brucei gambiense DAL972]XP_951647.1 hypothetical protein, conserved [Trypanosoma brucei brucei TREU927]AAX80177.1 hypothetical protein, conserved [Trypanosoma brucei]SCU66959.1 UNC119 [Trypanosoma equiperdum]BAH03833.1 uncoordinated 119 [Trypanosoma brucei brucei]AAQ15916.1 hypothetical protein, conserved [Trypanosoma brucei brucei TREU927]CBH09520.1 hypothetical protein, conserved [Trypanosoma brucei gambiense DAL972]|eukprot:XP_011771825.1 hypothetical protein, conserved [Trypanosoma brucei gambiense DAL972]
MAATTEVTPEHVLQLTAPSTGFLCPITANTYNIEFYSFVVRDADTKQVMFEVERDASTYPSVASLAQLPEEQQQAARTIFYRFPPSMLRKQRVSATLLFGVNGDKPVPDLRMIERHYFRNTLVKTFDFKFGFCIPHSRNTWEAVYDVPQFNAEWLEAIEKGTNEMTSDSFYFADGRLIMHNRAFYDYSAPEEEFTK